MISFYSRLALSFALVISLSGCIKVGPNFTPPIENLPPFSSIVDQAPQLLDTESAIRPNWWRSFKSDQLNTLVERALIANTDIRLATARLEQVTAARGVSLSALYPSIDVEASSIENRNSELGATPPGLPLEFDLHTVGANLGWELDLFGRLRRSVEKANADIEATLADRRGVLILVIAQTTASYFELRSLQDRLAIIEENEQIAKKSLELTELLVSQNLGAEFNVVRARAELSETTAQKTDIQAALRATAARIAVLTGDAPSSMIDELVSSKGSLPEPQLIPIGLPSQLVARRPDIRAAERRYASAFADIGINIANYFPRFSLTGGYDSSALSVDNLFSSASKAWTIGGVLNWPLLDFGRRKALVKSAKAGARGAQAAYDGVILSAFEDVERSLAAYVFAVQKTNHLKQAVTDRERALALAQKRFDSGLDNFFEVLDAQRRLAATKNTLAAARSEALSAQVRVYQSIGGGWEVAEQTLTSEPDQPVNR